MMYLKCIPNVFYQSIFESDYKKLQEQGIKTLFFDLDNTIISYNETELKPTDITFLKTLEKDFNILILSNSHKKRVVHACKESGFAYIWSAKKQLAFGFKKALRRMDAKRHQVAMIGDQLMTDIFGGNLIGFHTILVQAVQRKSDKWITRINRFVEKKMIKKIKKHEPLLYQERLEPYVERP